MQIKPAIIANPGKAAAGHAVNGARGDHGSGGTGGIGGIPLSILARDMYLFSLKVGFAHNL